MYTYTCVNNALHSFLVTASRTCSPAVPYHRNKAEPTTCITPGPQMSVPSLSMASQTSAKSVMTSVSVTLLMSTPSLSMIGQTPAKSVPVTLLTSTPSLSMANQTPAKSVMTSVTVPIVVLGALLGLFAILLAVVTTGWVCTCVAIKKKEAKRSQTHTRYKHVDNIWLE